MRHRPPSETPAARPSRPESRPPGPSVVDAAGVRTPDPAGADADAGAADLGPTAGAPRAAATS
jgi:hypothetical protein